MVNVSGLRVTLGERVLFNNESFLIRKGDRIGLVGPNGSGKSTIFKVITGREKPDDGVIAIDPGTVIGYFSQDVGEMGGRSALEEVLSGAGRISEIGKELSIIEHRLSEQMDDDEMERIMARYGELQGEFLDAGGYELETNGKTILSGLGIGEDRWDSPSGSFSGGWKMRIELAKILLLNPDLLLIDEPTNHLDMESIIWLESWLKSYKGAVVMTSHDRDFMTRLCSRTIETAAGAITTYSGDYDFYLREREIRREQLIASFKRQQAMLAKEEEFIAKFAARASHAAQVQSRVKTIEKIERIVVPPDQKVMKLKIPECRRSGDIVVSMDNLSKSWKREDGSELQVFSEITGTVVRQNKIALTGVNGAGKSTLLKVITSQTEATSGSGTIGGSVDTGYFSQYSSDILDPEKTIYEEVQSRVPNETKGYVMNLLGAFLFTGDDADKKISVLSGGEKSRVMLALLFSKPLNFLVLDEPTNHLDIASRQVLLNALIDFEGTVIVVSHDRYFLRSFVNRVFEIDKGKMNIYEGDYNYYLEKKTD